jgi:hypothetical protein
MRRSKRSPDRAERNPGYKLNTQSPMYSEGALAEQKFFQTGVDNYPIPRYKRRVLLAEGRQPVTSADGAGCGACCRGLVNRATGRPWATARPYYEGLPVVRLHEASDERGGSPGMVGSTGPGTEERSRGLKEERRK